MVKAASNVFTSQEPADLQRLHRYDAERDEYTIAIITDEDHAARVQLGDEQILMTASGDERFKGFKSEWATLKDDWLIDGSHGKKRAEQWIKIIDRNYRVQSLDWCEPYHRLCRALDVDPAQGYVVHEAAERHPKLKQWLFFPRKISSEPFERQADEHERGGNMLIFAEEHFQDISVLSVGERVPERGVSSFKIVPGHPDECIGLKSMEIDDRTATWFFCFDLNGNILNEESRLGNYKCEGVEIL